MPAPQCYWSNIRHSTSQQAGLPHLQHRSRIPEFAVCEARYAQPLRLEVKAPRLWNSYGVIVCHQAQPQAPDRQCAQYCYLAVELLMSILLSGYGSVASLSVDPVRESALS